MTICIIAIKVILYLFNVKGIQVMTSVILCMLRQTCNPLHFKGFEKLLKCYFKIFIVKFNVYFYQTFFDIRKKNFKICKI